MSRLLTRTGAAIAAAALLLTLWAIEILLPGPEGPPSSSYATTTAGAAAYAELLAREGHPVLQFRRPLDSVGPSRPATLMVLGAERLTAGEGSALRRFASGGGRLVIAGGDLASTLPRVIVAAPAWTPAGPTTFVARGGGDPLAGVRTVRTAGEGVFTRDANVGPGAAGGLTGAGGRLVAVRRVGAGEIVAVADVSPLQNSLLAEADNARFGLDLAGAGGAPVVFAEALHGYGEASGLAAVPGRWWVAFAIFGLAAVAWVLARGRRLGPAEPVATAPVPPRSDYVVAMTRLLVQSADADELRRLAGVADENGGARE